MAGRLTARMEVAESKCVKRAVVLLKGRPEIWPGTEGMEAFARALGATLFQICANREDALEVVATFGDSGTNWPL